MFVTFMTSVSDGHGAVLTLLVDGDLMISMRFAFGAVSAHLFRRFHTDQLRFATYERVSNLFLTNHRFLGNILHFYGFGGPLFFKCVSIRCRKGSYILFLERTIDS